MSLEPDADGETPVGQYETHQGWPSLELADEFTRALLPELDGLLIVVNSALEPVLNELIYDRATRMNSALALVQRVLAKRLARRADPA